MNERMKIILKIITKNFLENGTAMGSPTIARRKDINFSAATVRNIMSELEDEGFIRKTSVAFGREPTELGIAEFYLLFPTESQEKEFVLEKALDIEKELNFQLKKLSEYSKGVSFAVYKNKFIMQGNPVRMISKVMNLKREVLNIFSNDAEIEKICKNFLCQKKEFLYADNYFKSLKDFGISGVASKNKEVAIGTILLKNGDYKNANKAAKKILDWLENEKNAVNVKGSRKG
jgi:heat-inducible transcription repressor hrcA